MLFTDVQRSVRLNKKKKSTNTSPYPEFAAWQAEQAHHTTSKEKQEVPVGELPVVHIVLVCGFWQGASGWAHPVCVWIDSY